MASLNKRLIPLSSPDITEKERKAVLEVLNTRNLSLGPKLAEFEGALSKYVQTRYAVAVNSGTSGLHLCVKALEIKEGDEVITTPFSFVASANCVIYERAIPVFVDIDSKTLNLDINQIEGKINKKTKAILPVHVFGQPCDMEEILKMAKTYKLRVIEDSCEALGTFYKGKMVGTFGDCGVFAFYPNKQMTTGEGGAIVTNNLQVAKICRSLRNQGREEKESGLQHIRLGYNYRLSDIQCALGIAQLERIDELISKRLRVLKTYNRLFESVKEVRTPVVLRGKTVSWFVYVILLEESYNLKQRDIIIKRLNKNGISSSNYFPPIHLQPFYMKNFGYKKGDFPITEAISDRTIALPFHGNLTDDEIYYVVECFKKELRKI